MLMLPSHGWTAGLFGRRDRALLVVAAMAVVPYREMSRMTVGQVQVGDATAVATDAHGRTVEISAAADPARCGPCALARWRRVVDVDVRPDRRAILRNLLGRAHPVTSTSRHQCRQPEPMHPAASADVPLFSPINLRGTSRCRSGQ